MATENRSVDRTLLLNMTLVVEALLLLSATFWSHLAAVPLLNALKPEPRYLLFGVGCGIALAILSFLMLWLGKSTGIFAGLREITFQQIAPIFAGLSLSDLLVVAFVSGFCEEVLFRGVMLEQFGIFATSLVFGLFHCPSLRFLSYGLWVFGAGLFLGWIYTFTGNLWCPILAHAVSNCISLIFLRYAGRSANPEPPSEV